jgi:hypothetical protein
VSTAATTTGCATPPASAHFQLCASIPSEGSFEGSDAFVEAHTPHWPSSWNKRVLLLVWRKINDESALAERLQRLETALKCDRWHFNVSIFLNGFG